MYLADKITEAYKLAPKCSKCKITMEAIWIVEEEEILDKNKTTPHKIKTVRTRWYVSHFECPICKAGKSCDDSFASEWVKERWQ